MKRIVVKVGSAVLTQDGTIALKRMQALVDFLADLSSSTSLKYANTTITNSNINP